jgi:hypothetical protein
MSKEDLIPFNKLDPKTARMIQKMGGRAVSPQKKEAAEWREFKKRVKNGKIKSTDPQFIIERVENGRANKAEVLAFLDEIKQDTKGPARIALANTYVMLDKQMHPPITKTENLNINMNVSSKIAEAYLEMKKKQMEENKNE